MASKDTDSHIIGLDGDFHSNEPENITERTLSDALDNSLEKLVLMYGAGSEASESTKLIPEKKAEFGVSSQAQADGVYEYNDDDPVFGYYENTMNQDNEEETDLSPPPSTMSPATEMRTMIDIERARKRLVRERAQKRREIINQVVKETPSWILLLVFVFLLSTLVAGISLAMDVTTHQLIIFHNVVTNYATDTLLRWFIWSAYTITLVLFAIACTTMISPPAAGSGIPQMKTILSSKVKIKDFFAKRTLLAKTIGLVAFMGSGAISGKEGPLVHISSIIAHQLTRFRFFKQLREVAGMYHSLLAAAAATGVAANYGAPIGGLLFSIEVTSSYYPIRNYWFSAIATCAAALLYRVGWNVYVENDSEMMHPFLGTPEYVVTTNGSWPDFLGIIILGAICGPLGPLFTYLHSRTIFVRRWLSKKFSCVSPKILNFTYALLSILTVSTLTFGDILPFMGLTGREAMTQLIETNSLDGDRNHTTISWKTEGSVQLGLAIFFVTRFFLQVICLSLPCPSGALFPTLCLGAALGRLMGETVHYLFSTYTNEIVSPAIYAMVGAAALASSLTQAISTAVLVVEITGEAHTFLLIFMGTLIAFHISKSIHYSFYDSILKMRGLPFLPDLEPRRYKLLAHHIMEPVDSYLIPKLSLHRINEVLNHFRPMMLSVDENFTVPVVSSEIRPFLLGTIPFKTLESFAKQLENQYEEAATNDTNVEFAKLYLHEIKVTQKLSQFIESAPIQFNVYTSIVVIHRIMLTLELSHVFVTQNGLVKGIISTKGLKDALSNM
eukprot:TRINITY_DN2725_c0_g1_i1.p1 TRINITY_DN2725_c0_g1~~TRINITY_DN2725_c0_g1_i1.p1  ORF type:complete len:783 (-),score=115.10 TRINITY_DN2725_c0_g1_i1:135-2483(-)